MTIVINFGDILYWVAIIFVACFGFGIVVAIFINLMGLLMMILGVDRPIAPASPELPVSSAGFGWFLAAAAIVVALAVASIK